MGCDPTLLDAPARVHDPDLRLTAGTPYKLAALAAAGTVAAGWNVYTRAWRDAGGSALAYRDLSGTVRLQPAAPAEHRFRTGQTFRDVLRRSAAGRVRFPRVDFTREEVVLVASGPRSSSGYGLDLVRAVEQRGRIVLAFREHLKPGRAGLAYPYRLLVFERRDKPVHIDFEGRP